MLDVSAILSAPWASINWPGVNLFVQDVITIFAIVDPIGSLPIFVGLTEQVAPSMQRRLFRLGSLVALVLICLMASGGQFILSGVFGLKLEHFTVGGGLMLVVLGIQGILGPKKVQTTPVPQPAAVAEVRHGIEAEHVRLAVSPIAVPLLAGPGAIVTVMLIAKQSGVPYALAACLTCFAFVFAIMNWAHVVFRVLGRIGTIAIARVMDIFVVAIGVRFIFDGTMGLIKAG